MERLCGWAIGVPLIGCGYKLLRCQLYRGTRLLATVVMHRCRVQARQKKACMVERWVRMGSSFVRTTPPVVKDRYVWYGWQAEALRGGGCNGFDFPEGLEGQFRCRLSLRRTRALWEALPLRWALKTGVAKARGLLPGQRLVPPAEWTCLLPEALEVTTKPSADGRFLLVHVVLSQPCCAKAARED